MRKLNTAITHLLDFLALRLSPVLPWLYVALRRAAIPTMFATVTAILFFAVPQTREILHSFTAASPVSAPTETQPGSTPLVAYIATAFLLTGGVWYCSRLLCTIEMAASIPSALMAPPGATQLSVAVTWYPRILGLAVQAAALGALLFATFMPLLNAATAAALTTALLASPLCVYIFFHRRVVRLIAIAAAVAIAIVTCTLSLPASTKLWILPIAVLPTASFSFVIHRRRLLRQLGMAPSSAATFHALAQRLPQLFLLLVSSLLVLNAMTLLSREMVRALGSAAAVLFFLIAAMLALTLGQLVIRSLAQQVAGLTGAVALAVLALVAIFGSESLGQEHMEVQGGLAATALPPTVNDNREMLVNAYGGGLRAAIYTAEVLALADDMSCGQFGERIRAFSGVSGGSLGIATYLTARQQLHAALWLDCRVGAPNPATPLTDVVRSALVRDHLSPAIARMLAHDLPLFWQVPIRGQALLLSWQDGIVDAIASRSSGMVPGLGMRLTELDGGMKYRPAVYFNTADADNGKTAYYSNEHRTANSGPLLQPYDMTLGMAVLHSARFPIVTPAGKSFDRPARRLVDGGYADNSGAHTLARLFPDARPGAVLLDIDGNLGPDRGLCTAQQNRHSPIPTALVALLASRTARASDAVDDLISHTGLRPKYLTYDLSSDGACEAERHAERAPLGWFIGRAAAALMEQSAQRSAIAACAAAALDCRPHVQRLQQADATP
ncbi:hypothetical protein [Rugamonas aquatica]|uniref:PNPLA domain-containing protein n=1 Tax=Rugamonas aquatica TaxID=2743357 RepID=A0A6A7N2E1_9BURK|nr:hypothetical protein [Rugamonas aquatica]MQA39131.1 hypothetical protein [Rugamonas aquatica]